MPSTAEALDPSGTNLPIQALTSPGSTVGPQINSSGTIVFDAEVGTSPSNEKAALLAWQPGDLSPEILLAAGDTVDIDGNPEIIDDFTLNTLSNDYDYYKNALNDQNGLAVAVDYDDGNASAVLYRGCRTRTIDDRLGFNRGPRPSSPPQAADRYIAETAELTIGLSIWHPFGYQDHPLDSARVLISRLFKASCRVHPGKLAWHELCPW